MSSKVQNLTRPSNWKSLAPFPPSGSQTYAAQSKLPHLPVPALGNTLEQLRETLVPLARTKEELDEARRKIDVFAKEADRLQGRLEKRAGEREHWLEEWWDDGGYMGYRDSVVVNVSYYYGFSPIPKHQGQSPAVVAADLTRSALLFRKKLLNGQVTPEGTKEGPWCMDSWRYMFDACRIPGAEGLDWVTSHVRTNDTGDNGHVIVIRKGRFWKLDVSSGGNLLSSKELLRQFEHIYSNTTEEYPAVGVLTSANRDLWAKDYTELVADPHNASILETIHSAAFVVCLDTETPNDIVNFSRGLWHGAYDSNKPLIGLRNRWVDKPVQFIIFDNAKAGIMGEHSVMDGTPTARMCDDVLDAINSPDFDKDVSTSSSSVSIEPQSLDWEISPKTKTAIERATNEARELVGSQVLGYVSTSYGKKAIKSFGVSPDSWGQMIIQLAYARLLKSTGKQRDGATYEAAATRKFLKGRTETIRVVSSESDAWVAAMDDKSIESSKKKEMLKAAASKHIERAKKAGNGLGVDRHLLGLRYCVADGETVPALYDDPLYLRSKKWVLSTSAIHSKWFEAYGWGEVVPDGFGVPYTTGFDGHMQFTVTSRKEMPNGDFCAQLEKAAENMYELFAEEPQVKAKL